MAAQNNNNARSRAAQVRAKAIRTQIAAAFTYCSTAEKALVVTNLQRGHEAIEKASHVVQVVRAHLDEPKHVPADSITGILDELSQLEKRIADIEGQLPAATR